MLIFFNGSVNLQLTIAMLALLVREMLVHSWATLGPGQPAFCWLSQQSNQPPHTAFSFEHQGTPLFEVVCPLSLPYRRPSLRAQGYFFISSQLQPYMEDLDDLLWNTCLCMIFASVYFSQLELLQAKVFSPDLLATLMIIVGTVPYVAFGAITLLELKNRGLLPGSKSAAVSPLDSSGATSTSSAAAAAENSSTSSVSAESHSAAGGAFM